MASAVVQVGITVTQFELTQNSVGFRIQGVFPFETPAYYDNSIYFTSTMLFDDPGFSIPHLLSADAVDTYDFSEESPSGSGSVIASTGVSFLGDYFFVNFGESFSPGESIDKFVTAYWESGAFDPEEADEPLNVFWGASDLRESASGTFLTTTVPEPSTALLATVGVAGFLIRRKRR
ncbi:PEP-CTERM sorting domain-containing protein [Luteolibacter algae]|uniref:PEP-CTERM sorting domain-containing protein n=1 Tax=Luteolibacter algae TaxID=454151 RepID=A0ABW5DC52_9BACT